jgi:hypothetical protein
MMGLMYKPDLTWKNSSDSSYVNSVARAKVLHSGKVLHHHTYRGFTGGDVPRGLSKPEVKHVLKQLITQEPDYEGFFQDLPTDVSAFEAFSSLILPDYSEPYQLEQPSSRTPAPIGGPQRLAQSPLDVTETAPMGGPPRSSVSNDVPTTVQASVRNLESEFGSPDIGVPTPLSTRSSPYIGVPTPLSTQSPPYIGVPTPLSTLSTQTALSTLPLQYNFDRLPDIDKEWLYSKGGWAGFEDLPNQEKWDEVFNLRMLFLNDDPAFLTRVRNWSLQPSNQSPGYYLQFLRRDKNGSTMATRSYGWGRSSRKSRSGGVSPGYSFFTDRPPVWGRRWRHYQPTFGHLTVGEQNQLFGKVYDTEQEALEGARDRQKYMRDRKLSKHFRRVRGYGKSRKSKVHRSVKHHAVPKMRKPFSHLEKLLPDPDQDYQYEQHRSDMPAIEYLASIVGNQLHGAARSYKHRRHTGGAGYTSTRFAQEMEARRLADMRSRQPTTDMGMSRWRERERLGLNKKKSSSNIAY